MTPTDLARDALQHIPSDLSRDDWVIIGMAVHAAGLSFDDFDHWSSSGATYTQRAARDVWRSFKGSGIGPGTLFKFAKDHGWCGNVSDNQYQSETRPVRIDDPKIAARKRERLRQTWRETFPLTHANAFAVRRYLESRALGDVLKNPPTVLRSHAGLPYWDGTQQLGIYPAMVALFHGASGQPVTLHVTYLRSDGFAKASVPSPKKIMGVPVAGATKGGAIHLHEPRDKVLGVAEGIESALSLHVLQNIPVWATYCAGNMEHVRLPSGLRELRIGVDIDESGKGEQVAKTLAARVLKWSRNTKVFYVKPELDGPGDLNDDLRKHRQVS